MNVSYMIRIELDCNFTENNIVSLLQEASDQGVIYLKNFIEKKYAHLDVNQAAIESQKVVNSTLNDGKPFVYVKYYDTEFFLSLDKSYTGHIVVTCGNFAFQWDKNFEYGCEVYSIDFSRYIRLLFNILKRFTVSKVEAYSNSLKTIQYAQQHCVIALLRMGSFDEGLYYEFINTVKGNFRGLIENGIHHMFDFFDEKTGLSIQPLVEQCYDLLKAGFAVYLCAKKDDISFKIEVKRNEQCGYDFVSIYPLEPYCTKKGYGGVTESIDTAFYVQRLIELCENCAIYELKTFL